jgi:hypothetical protein
MIPSEVPSLEPSSNPSDVQQSLPSMRPSEDTIVFGLQANCQRNDADKFNICLDLNSTSGEFETWMQSFEDARDRWEQVIVEDTGLPFDAKPYEEGGTEFATEAPDSVDDVYIGAIVEAIDGVGNVLGSAGWTNAFYTSEDRTKIRVLTGFMRFDEADVEALMESGKWTGVILHEMGHVLGIGTLWEATGVYNAGEDEYLGSLAKAEWAALGCTGKLPVELDGGSGTAGGHWDEDCLDQELMTGVVDTNMKLSVITVASLEDMGYGVDYSAADAYDISMLDNCGTYCPEAPSQARRAERKKAISVEGRANVLKQAYKELSQARGQHASETMGGNSISVEVDFTTILYQDSGDMYSMTVTWEEALQHMKDSGEVEN